MATQVHRFSVEMTCEGCSNAVSRVLGKLEGQGISKFEVDLEKQTVLIHSTLPSDQLLETLKKTGKTVTYIGVQ